MLNKDLAKDLNLDFTKTHEDELSSLFTVMKLPEEVILLHKLMPVINLDILQCLAMEEQY